MFIAIFVSAISFESSFAFELFCGMKVAKHSVHLKAVTVKNRSNKWRKREENNRKNAFRTQCAPGIACALIFFFDFDFSHPKAVCIFPSCLFIFISNVYTRFLCTTGALHTVFCLEFFFSFRPLLGFRCFSPFYIEKYQRMDRVWYDLCVFDNEFGTIRILTKLVFFSNCQTEKWKNTARMKCDQDG